MNGPSTTINRRYDLDWLRVFGILTVFVFHSSRFFNIWDWHIKSPARLYGAEVFRVFAEAWMMPLIFLISGASIFFAMRKGNAGTFFKDKLLRLGVPLLVCIFTHASLQVYLERITHDQFVGSYFQWLPLYFEGWYMNPGGEGNFAWSGMHLWYLLFLLIFCLLCYPLFRWLKGNGQRFLDGFGKLLAVPAVAYLLFLPTTLFFDKVETSALGQLAPGGWPLPVYLLFFIMGFVIVSSQRLQNRILQMRWISLVGATLLMALYLYLMVTPATWKVFDDFNGPMQCTIAWFALYAFLGFGMKYLNISTPFLSYANEAVLPFYILHQTVLLSVGYFVVQWQIPAGWMWLIIAATSFAIIMLLYEYLVRRNNTLRFLFGMKPLPRQPVPEVGKALPA